MSETAFILGSGLGGVRSVLETVTSSVPFSQIPGMVVTSTSGHAGVLHTGSVAGHEVVVLEGRPHVYEGYPPRVIASMIEALSHLGVKRLILTNAAGGITARMRPGTLALITDHVNLSFRDPQTGSVRTGETRFTDMADPYDSGMMASLEAAARATGLQLQRAIYAGVTGPSYETPAEVRMLEVLGADIVGMSTVAEVIAARSRGIRCAALSCVTNRASGKGDEPLTHEAVLREAHAMQRSVSVLLRAWISQAK
jgi:purine-nucleoside phosphorylase